MSKSQTTIIPHSQQELVTRIYPSTDQVDAAIKAAAAAQKQWKELTLQNRMAICSKFLEEIKSCSNVLAEELTIQMGRCVWLWYLRSSPES
jgi:acyl-CoA reductase-like NAD-dependent aldehyde dehydrogenase